MTYRVLASVKLKTPQGAVSLSPGELVKLSDSVAEKLMAGGSIKPVDLYPHCGGCDLKMYCSIPTSEVAACPVPCGGKVALHVHSEVLGGHLWLVADNADQEALLAQGDVMEAVYTLPETQELKGKPVEHLKAVDEIKRAFPGSTVIKKRGTKGITRMEDKK